MGYIHLIRHGTTEANKTRKYYGSTDIPLANDGIDIITELAAADIYPKAEGASLYTTGLLRAEQTFFLFMGAGSIRKYRNFGNMILEILKMTTHHELMDLPDYISWISDEQGLLACPNGESTMDLQKKSMRRIILHYGEL